MAWQASRRDSRGGPERHPALREDEEVLTAEHSHAKEPALGDEDFLSKLKADVRGTHHPGTYNDTRIHRPQDATRDAGATGTRIGDPMSDQTPANRRRFHRLAYDAPAILQRPLAEALPCTVVDLSLKGCLVRLSRDEPLPDGQIHGLSIDLADDVVIQMGVVCSRREGLTVGLHCVSIDVDSITLLRRLVELNLGDADLLERDLHALVVPDPREVAERPPLA